MLLKVKSPDPLLQNKQLVLSASNPENQVLKDSVPGATQPELCSRCKTAPATRTAIDPLTGVFKNPRLAAKPWCDSCYEKRELQRY